MVDLRSSIASRGTARVEQAARDAGLEIAIRAMPRSTRTAAEAAEACGVSVGQIVKSLVFRRLTSGRPVLLLVSGENRVDLALVSERLGEAIGRADADEVRSETGFAIGGVAPLGSIRPIETFMDAGLLAFETVWAAAGAPNAVFAVRPAELARATGAAIIEFAERSPPARG